jgi:GNAT superfamily N-acetyltransferase
MITIPPMRHHTVTVEDDPRGELTAPIRQGLLAFNELQAGPQHQRRYALVVRDRNARCVGGLIADEHWGWLYVAWLWLPEAFRGAGLGSQLLRQAEEIAASHGCRHAYLSTFEFQALPFYEKHGYRTFGVLEDFPVGTGYRRFYLRRQLRDADGRT